MRKKKIISCFAALAMSTLMLPYQVFAGQSSLFIGYQDGVYSGYAYGKTSEKMRTSVQVKNGKIIDVRLDNFADDGRKASSLKSEFYECLKDYGPEFISRAIYELQEYPELILESGAENYFALAEKLMGKDAAEELKSAVDSSSFTSKTVSNYVRDTYVKSKWSEVDSISGATFSAKGIANASANAIRKSRSQYEANPNEITIGTDYAPWSAKSVPAKLYPGTYITTGSYLGTYAVV